MDWNQVQVNSTKNMSDKLFDEISKRILSGELPEGYVFPNEAVLCEQLHVGRSTIREAYKALELFGYVTRSKKGTFVNSWQAILSATPLKQAFSTANHADFNEFREMMEMKSAELAALRATGEGVAELKTIIQESQKLYEEGNIKGVAEKDVEFHRAIGKMSGNQLILSAMIIMTLAWDEGVRRNFFYAMKSDRHIFVEMYFHHEQIVKAIELRESRLAAQCMREHIRSVTAPLPEKDK